VTSLVVIRAFLIATILSAALVPAARRALLAYNLIDMPSQRSSHTRPTPRGGGVAVALAATVALMGAGNLPSIAAVAGIACLVGVVGLVDDWRGLRPPIRLLAQALIAASLLPLLLRGMRLDESWTWIFGLGVVLWCVAYVNAFNFMDGVNGMAVAQAVVGGIGLTLMGVRWSSVSVCVLGVAIAGAAIGFAPYNLPVARLFLGDVGSYFIGGWLAATLVVALRAGVPPEVVVAPFLLYLVDTGSTLWRRWRRGDNPMAAHCEHAYQRLTHYGWSHTSVSLVAAAAMSLCTGIALATASSPPGSRAVATVATVTIASGYSLLPSLVQGRRTRVTA
jgi:UDP-GlcNAc:undecaprenyl-phosphate/decaprenyl-phosphate GlcNAc-1-phosphate transferase